MLRSDPCWVGKGAKSGFDQLGRDPGWPIGLGTLVMVVSSHHVRVYQSSGVPNLEVSNPMCAVVGV